MTQQASVLMDVVNLNNDIQNALREIQSKKKLFFSDRATKITGILTQLLSTLEVFIIDHYLKLQNNEEIETRSLYNILTVLFEGYKCTKNASHEITNISDIDEIDFNKINSYLTNRLQINVISRKNNKIETISTKGFSEILQKLSENNFFKFLHPEIYTQLSSILNKSKMLLNSKDQKKDESFYSFENSFKLYIKRYFQELINNIKSNVKLNKKNEYTIKVFENFIMNIDENLDVDQYFENIKTLFTCTIDPENNNEFNSILVQYNMGSVKKFITQFEFSLESIQFNKNKNDIIKKYIDFLTLNNDHHLGFFAVERGIYDLVNYYGLNHIFNKSYREIIDLFNYKKNKILNGDCDLITIYTFIFCFIKIHKLNDFNDSIFQDDLSLLNKIMANYESIFSENEKIFFGFLQYLINKNNVKTFKEIGFSECANKVHEKVFFIQEKNRKTNDDLLRLFYILKRIHCYYNHNKKEFFVDRYTGKTIKNTKFKWLKTINDLNDDIDTIFIDSNINDEDKIQKILLAIKLTIDSRFEAYNNNGSRLRNTLMKVYNDYLHYLPHRIENDEIKKYYTKSSSRIPMLVTDVSLSPTEIKQALTNYIPFLKQAESNEQQDPLFLQEEVIFKKLLMVLRVIDFYAFGRSPSDLPRDALIKRHFIHPKDRKKLLEIGKGVRTFYIENFHNENKKIKKADLNTAFYRVMDLSKYRGSENYSKKPNPVFVSPMLDTFFEDIISSFPKAKVEHDYFIPPIITSFEYPKDRLKVEVELALVNQLIDNDNNKHAINYFAGRKNSQKAQVEKTHSWTDSVEKLAGDIQTSLKLKLYNLKRRFFRKYDAIPQVSNPIQPFTIERHSSHDIFDLFKSNSVFSKKASAQEQGSGNNLSGQQSASRLIVSN